MNEYKMTYHYPDSSTDTAHVVERTEIAARRSLTKRLGKDIEIEDVELVSTEACATKEQERETLEKIKAIVAELGPRSYLASAFEGVYEVAELNIEDDAAYSLKGQVESAEKRLREMGSVYNAAKSDAAHLKAQLDGVTAQLAAAQEQIAALKRQQLPEELRRDLWTMATTEAEASRARMAEAAEKMSAGADNPGCVLFKDSVALYRAEKSRAEAMEQRAAELDALEPKSEKGGAA